MKAVVQRVLDASVTVDKKITGSVSKGILVYVGFDVEDTDNDITWMINKLPNLRIFNDDDGKMNKSILDLGLGMLVISQFTLLANCKKGRRPSYNRAAKPEIAKRQYNDFLDKMKKKDLSVESGVFQAHMDVKYTNDGPITIILDSKE
ncbi:MAG: D-aminoacyl-tRNA deacylase [Spirochaetaceae bacterium]